LRLFLEVAALRFITSDYDPSKSSGFPLLWLVCLTLLDTFFPFRFFFLQSLCVRIARRAQLSLHGTEDDVQLRVAWMKTVEVKSSGRLSRSLRCACGVGAPRIMNGADSHALSALRQTSQPACRSKYPRALSQVMRGGNSSL
jgi:hypothetical protein